MVGENVGEDSHIVVGLTDDASGFFVADDGPGVPADRREAIIERIADAHGWTVQLADADASDGARFEFTGL